MRSIPRRLALRLALLSFRIAALIAALSMIGCDRSPKPSGEVLIAAAASMRVVLPDLTRAYEARTPAVKIVVSYGSSGELRKQVEGGAPIDGVIFASAKPVDDLIKAGKADALTRRVLATNQLVLIGPKGAKPLTFETLATVSPTEKIAIGDPGAVPAGQYAREVLQKKGVWDALQGRLVLGSDVAAVLTYARRGEVAAAIVYRTDIRGIDDVVQLDAATGDWAPRVEIVSATVTGAKGEADARAFLAFLASAEGQKLLADHGFGPP